MTLHQTVNVTQDRLVHLDLPIPDNIPIGKAEIKIVFISSENIQFKKKKNTRSLCGMFYDTGDTLDKFLARKQIEKQLEYENG